MRKLIAFMGISLSAALFSLTAMATDTGVYISSLDHLYIEMAAVNTGPMFSPTTVTLRLAEGNPSILKTVLTKPYEQSDEPTNLTATANDNGYKVHTTTGTWYLNPSG